MANKSTIREAVARLEEQVKYLTLTIRDEVTAMGELRNDLHNLDLKIVPVNGLSRRINTISNRVWGLLVGTVTTLGGIISWVLFKK